MSCNHNYGNWNGYGEQCLYCSKRKEWRSNDKRFKLEELRKKVLSYQEFKESAEQEGVTPQELISGYNREELGAILGYWYAGDNGWRPWQ